MGRAADGQPLTVRRVDGGPDLGGQLARPHREVCVREHDQTHPASTRRDGHGNAIVPDRAGTLAPAAERSSWSSSPHRGRNEVTNT